MKGSIQKRERRACGLGIAHVELTLQNINDAPVVTVDQHLKPIYGYDAVYRWYGSSEQMRGRKLAANAGVWAGEMRAV
ncbi:MAG: hypothetical protein PHY62_04955 [Gallionella sp.]|nr:hypothetical protein [Gallionella sp.]